MVTQMRLAVAVSVALGVAAGVLAVTGRGNTNLLPGIAGTRPAGRSGGLNLGTTPGLNPGLNPAPNAGPSAGARGASPLAARGGSLFGGPLQPPSRRQLKGHTDGVTALEFSPDGKLLASGGADQQIILWDVAQDKQVKTLAGHSEVIRKVRFSPDGKRLLSVANDRLMVVWDVEKGEIESVYPTPWPMRWAYFLPDGKHFVTGYLTDIYTWEVGSTMPVKQFKAPEQFPGVAVDAAGMLITGHYGGKLIVWDPMTGRQVKTHDRPVFEVRRPGQTRTTNTITGVSVMPDGHVLVGDMSGTWEWDRGTDQFTLIGWTGMVSRIGGELQGAFADEKYYFGLNSGEVGAGFMLSRGLWVREKSPSGVLLEVRSAEKLNALVASKDGLMAFAGGGEWADAYQQEWKHSKAGVIYLKTEGEIATSLAASRKSKETALARRPELGKLDETQVEAGDVVPSPWH